MIDDKRIEFKQNGCSYSISENKYQEFLSLKPWKPSKKIILPKRCGCGFRASSVDRPSLHPDYVIAICAKCGGVRVQRIELPVVEGVVIQVTPQESNEIPSYCNKGYPFNGIKHQRRSKALEIILSA